MKNKAEIARIAKAFNMTNPRPAVVKQDVTTKAGLAFYKGEKITVYENGLVNDGPYKGRMGYSAFSRSNDMFTAIRPSSFDMRGGQPSAAADRADYERTMFPHFTRRNAAARAIVLTARPYAEIISTDSLKELREMVRSLESAALDPAPGAVLAPGITPIYSTALGLATSLDEADHLCRVCGEVNDDGEGWDGLCGNCADRAEKKKKAKKGTR